MCTTAEATLIIEVLDEKVQNQEVFTAFDVTSAARSKTDDNIRHSDVRNIVNNAHGEAVLRRLGIKIVEDGLGHTWGEVL